MSDVEEGAKSGGISLSGFGGWVAVAVLVAFGVLIVFLIGQRGAGDTEWNRLMLLLSGVEAIAFAAAGALFGTEVQRRQTERAEKKATDNANDAENGRTLARMIKLEGAGSGDDTSGLETVAAASTDDAVARHVALADKLFPGV